MVIADVLARYNQLKTDKPSFMLTGTDEHGSKVQRAAENNQQSPQELCEAVSDRFRVCKISRSRRCLQAVI
jgi:methionyl-tRNA synthetase